MNKTSKWNSVFTFIMAMIGLTIGIGNIGDSAMCSIQMEEDPFSYLM